MNLGQDCFQIGTVIHEFLHCLGFIHQHSSPERDEYITINYDNIDPGNKTNHFHSEKIIFLKMFRNAIEF